jgi:hypothetical protein
MSMVLFSPILLLLLTLSTCSKQTINNLFILKDIQQVINNCYTTPGLIMIVLPRVANACCDTALMGLMLL